MALHAAPPLSDVHKALLMGITDRAAARAAAVGLWPGLEGILATLEQRPVELRRVPAGWLAVVLALLDDSTAAAALETDPRQAAADAGLERRHIRRRGAGRGARGGQELVLDELETWTAHEMEVCITGARARVPELLAAVDAVRRVETRRQLNEAFVTAVLTRDECDEELFLLARTRFQELVWSRPAAIGGRRRSEDDVLLAWSVSHAGLEWFEGAPVLHLGVLQEVYSVATSLAQLTSLCDTLGFVDAVPAALRLRGVQALHGGTQHWGAFAWIVVDRALDEDAHASVDLGDEWLELDDALELAGLLRSEVLRARLVAELRAGRCGLVLDPNETAAVRAVIGEDALVEVLAGEALAVWLTSAEPPRVEAWAAQVEAVDAAAAFAYLDREAPFTRRLARLVANHTPGLAALVLSGQLSRWVTDQLHVALVAVLTESLGADPLAWQAAWSLLEGFPGSTLTALEVVQATQA